MQRTAQRANEYFMDIYRMDPYGISTPVPQCVNFTPIPLSSEMERVSYHSSHYRSLRDDCNLPVNHSARGEVSVHSGLRWLYANPI